MGTWCLPLQRSLAVEDGVQQRYAGKKRRDSKEREKDGCDLIRLHDPQRLSSNNERNLRFEAGLHVGAGSIYRESTDVKALKEDHTSKVCFAVRSCVRCHRRRTRTYVLVENTFVCPHRAFVRRCERTLIVRNLLDHISDSTMQPSYTRPEVRGAETSPGAELANHLPARDAPLIRFRGH